MSDGDDDLTWDEHASWAAFLDDGDDQVSADRTAIVDRLGPAFASHHHHVKEALVPVLQHTKQLHDTVQNDIFPRRSQGLVTLNDANQRHDSAAHRDRNSAQAVYDDARHSLDALISVLDDLIRQSDVLFQTFKTTMHEHVRRLRRCTDQMPVDVERLIGSLDKRARHLGAEDHARAKENLLRGILEEY